MIASWCNGSTRASRSFSLGSNPSGATNFKRIMIKEVLKEMYDAHIQLTEQIVQLVNEHELQNEQDYLDWQDRINELSVL